MSDKKKKYLFLITGMPMGGAERVMSTLANQFVAEGASVRLVTLKEAKSAYPLDKRIEFVGGDMSPLPSGGFQKKLGMVKSAFRSIAFYRKQLQEFQPDVVLSFLTNTNLLAIITKMFSMKKFPVIISERADPRKRSKFLIRICNWIYPKADCIVCQSKVIEEYFRKVNRKSKTKVIANPINENCINLLPVTDRQKRIVAVGRLSKQKNYELLIESFSLLAAKYPDFRLEIYGQGPEEAHLLEKIQREGLSEQVFLMGVRENVMKEAADAAAYVMSSDFEGFPNALAEAMASGIPVISTDFPTGIAHELIVNGKNGFVVPVGDAPALADAIEKIISNPELQVKMSQNNIKLREKLNIHKIYKEWKVLFEAIEEENSNE